MIELASPDIRPEDIQRVVRVLESGNLVQSVQVTEFENSLVDFSGIDYCAAVSSGTAALHLALLALGIGPGDHVIVPGFTFPATANAVLNTGADVILADVSPEDYVVTPESIERAVRENADKQLKAVMVVHEFGCPVDVAAIRTIADRYGLKLIEDAACALGTMAQGKHVGYFGDAACFSFHPRKAITTGEGGAVMSRDAALIAKVMLLRNHGIQLKNSTADFVASGFNYRLTDIQAALGIGQLRRFRDELAKRDKLAAYYTELLTDYPGVSLPSHVVGHSWQSYMVVLDDGIERKQVMDFMKSNGVNVNLGAQALHDLTYYREKYGFTSSEFINSHRLFDKGLVLPLYGKLDFVDLQFIVATLRKALNVN